MRLFKNRYFWLALLTLAIVAIVIYFTGRQSDKYYTVKKGSFQKILEEKGEIEGKNSINITIPDILTRRDLNIYQLQIKDLIQEGKRVKKGDWIATLDIGEINQRIQNNNQDLEKSAAELKDAKIDSTIQLTNLREELNESKYDLKFKKLEVDQSIYESPAYQRKIKIDYDRLVRTIQNKERNYQLRQINLKSNIKRIERRYEEHKDKQALLRQALSAGRVRSPRNGMVMYAKKWNNQKIQAGDQVSRWSPTIAVLPNMSVAVSVTYIKEIDITKIAVGDNVAITIDAIPDKEFQGKISQIANIGQEMPGFDSKVFRITIDIESEDAGIKPAMTTNNKIILADLKEVITVPRQTVFSANDSTYVYLVKNNNTIKQFVTLGDENEENIIVLSGLQEKDKILLHKPE